MNIPGFGKKKPAEGRVGLTIQTEGVAVAHISHAGVRPTLLACREYPVDPLTTLDAVLKNISADRSINSVPINSVLNASDFHLQLMEKPQVQSDELKQAVRWKIRDMIDFPVDEAVIDVFDIPGQKEKGRTELIYVVAARRQAVQAHIQRLEGQRLPLEIVDIPEMAQRNVASLLPENKGGVALLNLREQSGLLTISRDSVLYLSRRLDVGLSSLVAGEGGLSAGGEGAELSLDVIDSEQQQMLDTIVLEVQRSLDYYESHFSQPPVQGLVIAPLAHPVPGLLDYFAGSLGVQVRILDLASIVDFPEPLDDVRQAHCFAAIGAALRAA